MLNPSKLKNFEIQKKYERFLLERFIEVSGLNVKILDVRENPDFIVEVDGQNLGIEITNLYIRTSVINGMLLQAQESIATRIVCTAQRIYSENNKQPMHVSVLFNSNLNLKFLDRSKTAYELANYISRLNIPTFQRVCLRASNFAKFLPEEISYIQIYGVPHISMAHWNVVTSGWTSPLSTQILQARIDEKSKRIHSYKKSTNIIWLLIVADATKASQLVVPKNDYNSLVSPFDRTFFYRYPDNILFEL